MSQKRLINFPRFSRSHIASLFRAVGQNSAMIRLSTNVQWNVGIKNPLGGLNVTSSDPTIVEVTPTVAASKFTFKPLKLGTCTLHFTLIAGGFVSLTFSMLVDVVP